MENSYGIGVRNRYELFYDEDIDPMDLLKQSEKIKDKASEKENKGKTAKAKAPVVKKGVKTETAPKIADKTSVSGECLQHFNINLVVVNVPHSVHGRLQWSQKSRHVRSSGALLFLTGAVLT
ncbi:putative Intracellular hyaluronan-binding protein 4 N-terminal-containing protein [Homarus americanus]|uniref:Putative Intracellular hyaluronan-binding protein 4 N-terminal-containing protein n=1 Tax=Homarus americanus TaxID=6706 RepID=A0A8J5N0M5_HOMAM|nr:putative Intracellular hyaluronan-binding protein 4 N-terminal-containing protein [Homarus americanus]